MPAVRNGAAEPELSIVIPVHNEAATIGDVLRSIRERVRASHEVILVYDSENDETLPVVRAMVDADRVRLQRNTRGPGVLNALKAGLEAATAPYVLVAMADGSDDHSRIDEMIDLARAGADIVAASRYARGGRQIGAPVVKGMLSRAAGLTLHRLAGIPVHDATNNFRLYSQRFLRSVTIESRGGFEVALELTVKAAASGRTLCEVPTTWRERASGRSRFPLARWLPHYLRWYLYAFGIGR